MWWLIVQGMREEGGEDEPLSNGTDVAAHQQRGRGLQCVVDMGNGAQLGSTVTQPMRLQAYYFLLLGLSFPALKTQCARSGIANMSSCHLSFLHLRQT